MPQRGSDPRSDGRIGVPGADSIAPVASTAPVAPVAPTATSERYSVALCTFNGARFVAAQLDSIVQAEPPPNRIVVVDDASSDDTVARVGTLLQPRTGADIVSANPTNIGSLRSFERALGLVTDDIVFLADQDDLWHRDKPRRMLAAFAARPDLLLLHSDARIVDDDARPLGYTLLQAIEASGPERAAIHDGDPFDAFIRRNIATGATIAMRRQLLDAALPIPDDWVHDEWLATVASAIGTVDFLDEPLIDYRQHAGNQIGARRLSLRDKVVRAFSKSGDFYPRQVRRWTALQERLDVLGPAVADDRREKLRRKLAHLRVRAALPANRLARLGPVAREWRTGAYHRYSTGTKSVVRDLFHRAE